MNADLYEQCTSVVIQQNGKAFISISDSYMFWFSIEGKKNENSVCVGGGV